MSWFKGKSGTVKVTVELDEEMAEAIGVLARKETERADGQKGEVTVAEMVEKLLSEAMFMRDAKLRSQYASATIRMANMILSYSIDAPSDAMRLTKTPDGVLLELEKQGKWETVQIGVLGTIPNHIYRPLVDRYETMGGTRLQSRAAKKTGTMPIKHAGKRYDPTVGYEDNLDSETGESLVIRFPIKEQENVAK